MLLAACQSGPKPVPGPEPAVEAAPVVAEESAPTAEAAALPEPEPEPEDFYQQFYTEAVSSLKSGKTKDALELLKQVSTDAPDKPYVFTNLGLAYFKLKQPDLAEQAFQEAVKRNNDDAVAHNHLGILQRHKGAFEEARKHYQRAIDIDSNYAPAYLNLGILFDIYFQDLVKALRHYQKYQALISEENSQVTGWIADIERRLKSSNSSSQG
jgi:tetratricopeptide (TPR) repeat protein